MENAQARPWRTVEELVEIGFSRSRIVMMNEIHSGDMRCVRTRVIGQRILPTAHRLGVRYLAMEALFSLFVEYANVTRQLPTRIAQLEQPEDMGYLSQPEMKAFIQTALDLGWKLIPYEADFNEQPLNLSPREEYNWREEMQAHNLIAVMNTLPEDGKMLVWCGNNHHTKALVPQRPDDPETRWALMGYQFRELSGIDPFVIDQGRTVLMPGRTRKAEMQQWLDTVEPQLTTFGGTAGFLAEEAPSCFGLVSGDDAYVVSLDNTMK